MAENKELARVWFIWRRTPRPVHAYRNGRRNAPTFRLEHDLDHLAGYVYQLGSSYMTGGESDYTWLTSGELADLEKIEAEVARCPIPEDEKETYRRYVAATRAVLQALAKADRSLVPRELFDPDRGPPE